MANRGRINVFVPPVVARAARVVAATQGIGMGKLVEKSLVEKIGASLILEVLKFNNSSESATANRSSSPSGSGDGFDAVRGEIARLRAEKTTESSAKADELGAALALILAARGAPARQDDDSPQGATEPGTVIVSPTLKVRSRVPKQTAGGTLRIDTAALKAIPRKRRQ
jgi:hypothetical protein